MDELPEFRATEVPMVRVNNGRSHHMEYDYTELAADPDSYLTWALGQVGAALSLRTESEAESEWIYAATRLASSFPDPMVRAHLAARCTLRQLLAFVHDDHLAVRLSCVDNPFVVDRDVQVALCADPEPAVVDALLYSVEPCIDACRVLLARPEPRFRQLLVSARRSHTILTVLSHDEDPRVRDLAAHAIQAQDRLRGWNSPVANWGTETALAVMS